MSRPKANTQPTKSIAKPITDGDALVDQFERLKSAVFSADGSDLVNPIQSEEYPALNDKELYTRLFSLDERIEFSEFVQQNGGTINCDAVVNRSIILGISNADGVRIFNSETEAHDLEKIAKLHPLFRLELWRKVMEFNSYLDPPKQVAAKKSEKTES